MLPSRRVAMLSGVNAQQLIMLDTIGNLFLSPYDFDNANWTKSAATVSANAIAAPDGTLTADKIQEDNANTNHITNQSVTTAAALHEFSVYLKAAERINALLYHAVTGHGRVFNLAGGSPGGGSDVTPASLFKITRVGSAGWYRCSIKVLCTAAANNFRIYGMIDGTSHTYLGVTGSGVYAWGASLRIV